ncbi:uncharacterized protein PV06_02973 [Exophiala oligosperma]|uniref:SET domain-containing protein n=1 Tax=Exophiala oligosperma TaxID=215243 RepID=A0A0D2AXK7_9EURO|nr:uncharacterized protein PV06_02973 [Exophiala oligosperma]KIW44511.1 hypothetical protein PV06_02973 [Exophiala oligosperma]
MHVIGAFFSIFALGQQNEEGLYQLDSDQLFQSFKPDLQTESSDSADHVVVANDNNKYAPWSYRPICTDVLEEIDSELCVYTSTTFAGGRGLSLFTTPRVAKQMMMSSAWSTLFIDDSSSSDSTNSALGPKVEVNADDTAKWYTKPVPGKGMGMFAKSPLDRGDLIMATTPILIAFSENILDATTREEYLRVAIDQLPGQTRDTYQRLASLSKDEPETRIQDTAAANTFGITLAGHFAHLAVFPEASRMNHDCSPNAQFRIDNETLTQYVRAVRAVGDDDKTNDNDNEELTIAYTSPLDDWKDRQDYLSRSFGFRCGCARCRRGQKADSEALSEIYNLQSSLQSSLTSSSSSSSSSSSKTTGSVVAEVERLIRLYEREGLQGYMDPVYCLAALIYSSIGSKRGVGKYVDLAVEAIELRLGPENQDIPIWKEMAKQPERHWSWKRRKAKQ